MKELRKKGKYSPTARKELADLMAKMKLDEEKIDRNLGYLDKWPVFAALIRKFREISA